MPEAVICPDIETPRPARAEVYERLDRATAMARREEREQLRPILECDRYDLWKGNGARSHAEFLAGRLNISQFKARRHGDTDVSEAHTLEQRRADALRSLCSAQIANDQDPDRAKIVVNATAEIVLEAKTDKNATVESGS